MVNLLSAILYLIIPFFMLSILTDANPLSIFCSGDNYTHGSTFELNLKLLLQSLPSNTSPTGFYNKSSGDEANRVYGQAVCRGDVHPTVCKNCIANAGDLSSCCRDRKGGIVFSRNCNVRFEWHASIMLQIYSLEVTSLHVLINFYGEFELKAGGKWKIRMVAAVACIFAFVIAVLIVSYVVYLRWKKGGQEDEERSQSALHGNCGMKEKNCMFDAEVMRCIHIGQLCVQEDPEIRPTMSSVVALLASQSIPLPDEPRQPPFSVGRIVLPNQSSTTDPSACDVHFLASRRVDY
ncbi:hypothetical protein Pint_10861 [Pistacia integerrima]|uniref:Uncharacterized protein n=1 Tax=Pistacia integerrima TaxID=434235 RepID=A0ACC0XJF9_9ROSI|nr:hypothetical protein Pint_10861 [Pistacia integerrima]